MKRQDPKTVSRPIADVIKDSEMSQAEISRRLIGEGFKVNQSHISKIASGMIPSINLGLAIARILEVPALSITWGQKDPTNANT